MTRDLTDAVVLVAGASGALGGRLATGLADRGARVVATGRDEQRLAALPTSTTTVVGDLRDPDLPQRLVTTVLDTHGRLDGVVNAAGVVAFGALEDTDDEVLATLFDVNVLAPLRLVRAALPHLDGGFVVDVSAVVAEMPTAGMAAYSASKAALTAAGTALQRELRRRRIHVLDARPPHTETGLADRPIVGTAPALPTGLDPDDVVATILDAIEAGTRALPAEAFVARG